MPPAVSTPRVHAKDAADCTGSPMSGGGRSPVRTYLSVFPLVNVARDRAESVVTA